MYYLGLDVGGTKLEAAAIDRKGTVIRRERILTEEAEGADAVMRRIFGLLDTLLLTLDSDKRQVIGLGVGVPGAVDHATGVIHTLVNLTGWSGLPLGDLLAARYKMPIIISNDANAALLGESMFGNGIGVGNLLYITASTGIGGGVMVGGNIVSGETGAAGEVGHMVLEPGGLLCNCGHRGCWETLSSGTAIAKAALQRISAGEKSSLQELPSFPQIAAEHVFAAYRQGDKVATEVTDRALFFLGLGIANLVNVLNPARVLLGGGVASAGHIVFTAVEEVVQHYAYGPARGVKIMPALLGAQAGVVGAAALIMRNSNYTTTPK